MQEAIKNILILIKEHGLSQDIYNLVHFLTFFVAIPFFMWLAKKMNVNRKRAFFALLINCATFLVLMNLIGWIEAKLGLGNFGRKNVVTVYGWIPLICLLSAKTTKLEWNTLCTMMAPTMPFIQAVSRPGCLVAGCCKGFQWQWGIYNANVGEYRFPMPVFEMLWMLAIVWIVIRILKRLDFKPEVWVYPFMLVIYGLAQFVSEFFIDNAKIVGSLSLRSFHELSLILIGIVWILVLWYNREKKKL